MDHLTLTLRLVKLSRVARGWKQSDLALVMGTSRERISQIETGRTPPGYITLVRLADALDSDELREIARQKLEIAKRPRAA